MGLAIAAAGSAFALFIGLLTRQTRKNKDGVPLSMLAFFGLLIAVVLYATR